MMFGTLGVFLKFICYFILFYFFNKFIYLFTFGCGGFSLLGEGFLQLRCVGFLLWWLILLQSTGSKRAGFSSCGSRASEHRLSSCGTQA